MSPPTSDEGYLPKERTQNFEGDGPNRNNWRKAPQNGFKDQRNWRRNDRGYMGKDQFKNNGSQPARKKKGKGKGKKSQNKVEVLKKNDEYSHLINSTKLTVFDWDCTIVLRNLPPQIDAVKKLVQRELKEIAVAKFCPIKKTFKSNALVTLACVLNNKGDVDKAVAKLSNLKVGDYHCIVSRFVKPHCFISNAFSACILNFPNDASEKQLSEILKDCGIISSLDVEYSESGSVKKVLVNLSNESALVALLRKDGTLLKTATLEIIPIKPSSCVIVGNVHAKISNDKLGRVFGDDVLLVQKMSNMIFQVFFKNEESAEKALIKDGTSVKDLIISVRPWSKKNSKLHKVFVHITGNEIDGKGTFDVHEFLRDCGKLCSITAIKKNAMFAVTFESKESQRAALELNGKVVNGKTVEVTKKPPAAKKSDLKFTDRNTANDNASSLNSISKRNHVYFD